MSEEITRRTLIAGASTGLAGAALLGRGLLAGGNGAAADAACDCVDAPGSAQFDARQLAMVNLQSSANIPTPREQTVIVETHKTTVYDSFNPYIPNGEAWLYGVNQLLRECMFYANFLTGEIKPWLAEKWTYNADFTELTLALNPAAMWSDGQPFTSADVVFSLEMLRANDGLTGSAQVKDNVTKVAAPDAHTVVLTLNSPQPRYHYNFIAGIVFDVLRVVPKHLWEKEDPNTFKFNPPVYTGSYLLDQIIPAQFMYVWKKNPNYWNKAAFDPKPGYVVFREYLPTDAEMQEFQRGNIDVANNDSIGYLNQQALLATYNKAATMQFADPCPRGFFPNFDSPSGLFKTAEGRWAISYLVDRDLIGKSVWQPPSRAAKFPWADYTGNAQWSNADIQKQYDLTYDPAKAEAMLAKAGAVKTDGKWTMNGSALQLTMIVPGGTTVPEYAIGQTLVDNAKEIGLDIVLSGLTIPAFYDAFNLGQFDLTSHQLCGQALDPYQLYNQFLGSLAKPVGTNANNSNPARMQIPELDDAITTLKAKQPDYTASKPAFDTALEVFMKELPAIPSIQTLFASTCGTAYWTGWPTDADPYNVPLYWWAQFLFVIGKLQPVTQ